MPLTREEAILLEGCRKGGERAWLALYRAYGRDVGVYLKGMVCHGADVEDLVQKVFLGFLTSMERFRGETSIRTWLHRIARHVAQHEARSNRRRAHYANAYAQTVQAEATNPEARALARVELTQVHGALSELDASFREVWVLRELVGLSVAETAAVLETLPTTVRTRHLRARRRMLAILERRESPDIASPVAQTANPEVG